MLCKLVTKARNKVYVYDWWEEVEFVLIHIVSRLRGNSIYWVGTGSMDMCAVIEDRMSEVFEGEVI
jgi:hypothetical protein